ncbi:hypothetical protein TNCV_4405681 [Trichonephila clavipes]|uniref:Uncharacterized protein n=1 Tax=Trichonephila clavipes TaxID=2585209 RepID=A0A8X6VFE8_TRICX|nr:hypothetical protein TNCV_4405681 [Trichonephila clavipes]
MKTDIRHKLPKQAEEAQHPPAIYSQSRVQQFQGKQCIEVWDLLVFMLSGLSDVFRSQQLAVAKNWNHYRPNSWGQHPEALCMFFMGAMTVEFVFMDDNTRLHRANNVSGRLQSEDITRMDWSAF